MPWPCAPSRSVAKVALALFSKVKFQYAYTFIWPHLPTFMLARNKHNLNTSYPQRIITCFLSSKYLSMAICLRHAYSCAPEMSTDSLNGYGYGYPWIWIIHGYEGCYPCVYGYTDIREHTDISVSTLIKIRVGVANGLHACTINARLL